MGVIMIGNNCSKSKPALFLLLTVMAVSLVFSSSAQEPAGSSQTPQQTGQQPAVYVCPMHRDVSSKVPGKCPKCGMTLVASASQDEEFYACPMHADVMTTQPGKCPKCGMTLKRMAAPVTDEFQVSIETTPKLIRPGQKVRLRFSIFNPKTGVQVKKFNILHDMPFHLFVVSQDFSHFDHIHPTEQPDGSFTIETALPRVGVYQVYCDFFPDGGLPQVIHQNLITAGFAGDVAASQANLVPDKNLTRTLDGMRFELKFDPVAPVAGKPAILKYHITDARTGQPVTDLQPYLGAWGHTLILSEDATDYLHSHPTEMIPEGVDRSRLASKADIDFDTFFPRPGNYRIWSQFQRNNRITTVSFNVYVPRMNQLTN
ncbi:MAG TPA: heavy metal-binding domain-containing protein [Blastocatellia bacterium]|nr:heavy metal-binding domain-containing protein [Blastocatellia bacterium]